MAASIKFCEEEFNAVSLPGTWKHSLRGELPAKDADAVLTYLQNPAEPKFSGKAAKDCRNRLYNVFGGKPQTVAECAEFLNKVFGVSDLAAQFFAAHNLSVQPYTKLESVCDEVGDPMCLHRKVCPVSLL